MVVCHVDFESRSACELKTAGLDNYSKHPSTDVWCCAYAIDDEDVRLVSRENAQDEQYDLCHFVRDGATVVAHNAAFELAIWNNVMVPRYGWPPLKPEQVRCTMAMAYAMALPGSLEKAAAAVGIKEQKDLAGGRVMMKLAKPRSITPCPHCTASGRIELLPETMDGSSPPPLVCGLCKGGGQVISWWDDPKQLEILYEYCRQDVRVERELDKRLMQLSADEQRLWQLDYKINQRGVYVDRATIHKAMAVVQIEQARLNKEMRDVTKNYVGFCTEAARLTRWVQGQGVPIEGIAKADVTDALDLPTLPENVRRALELRREAGRSSTAKLRAMAEAASADGRLRGMLQYHGAGTGRWAGRRVQLHNIPRWPKWFKAPDAEDVITALLTRAPEDAIDYIRVFYGAPMEMIVYLLRPLLCAAPGHELMAADFASIEGRGLAWLAGEDRKLQAYYDFDAKKGPDPYNIVAGWILNKSPYAIDDDERQARGKVPDLACGYGGGVGAFQKMAKTYGVKMADEEADAIKIKWREAHPETVNYWYRLEDAAMQAVRHPGHVYTAGAAFKPERKVAFKVKGSFLWCRLPSGRVLCYPYPKIKPRETPWGEMKDQIHYMTVDGTTNKWEETHTYGGKLSENVTQAICRDLLASAIERCEREGYPVVLHVHDEVVSEVPAGADALGRFESVCSRVPEWAAGLPVVAKGWCGKRYRK